MKCIFCGNENNAQKAEHIIPASFAGENSKVLLKGLVCDSCNNYFSHSFENDALNDFPFNIISLLYSIPNRNGKSRKIETEIGTMLSMNSLENVILLPNEHYDNKNSNINLIINSNPKYPVNTCKLLGKIGLEYLCYYYSDLIYDSDYDDLRKFVRFPSLGMHWCFSIGNQKILMNNINSRKKVTNIETVLIGNDKKPTLFCMMIFGLQLQIPIIKDLVDKEIQDTKDYRKYSVQIKREKI